MTGYHITLCRYVIYSIIISLLTSCDLIDNSEPDTVIDPKTPVSAVKLQQTADCSSLRPILVSAWAENLLSMYRYPYFVSLDNLADDGVISDDEPVAAGTPADVSQTNVQEAGVDEADIVKADSLGRVYIALHDMLIIEQAFPPESMHELAQLSLGAPVTGLYLDEASNTLIAVTRLWNLTDDVITINDTDISGSDLLPESNFSYNQPAAELIFIDITDPSAPVINERIQFDGALANTRRIEERLHLVSNFYLPEPAVLYTDVELQDLLNQYNEQQITLEGQDNDLSDLEQAIEQRVAELISDLDIASILPSVRYPLDANETRTHTLQCNDIYHPSVTLNDTQLLIVSSINLDAGNLGQSAILGSGWLLYASLEDLYISQSSSGWWWNSEQPDQTAIHHFSISANDPLYLSTGLVSGHANNVFSFSHYQGHLRVATTEWFWNLQSDRNSTNHLYIMSDDGAGGMTEIGAVTNFANNESIYSSRFMDGRAFIVTFRQIDPLFSFDLSDPTSPQLTGELELPGFSTYMHPIDDNHLLTIGRGGDANGANGNLQLKIFDISDLAEPQLVDQFSPDFGSQYSWSEADWDHHAFLYYEPSNVLAIPLSTYNSTTETPFDGIVAIDIDLTNGMSELGRIDHNDLAYQAYCIDVTTIPYFCDGNSTELSWLARPRRSVIMTDNDNTYLYSISNLGIKAAEVNNLSTTLGDVLFPLPEEYPYYWWLY